VNPNVNPNVNITNIKNILDLNPQKETIIKTMLTETPVTQSILFDPLFTKLNNVEKRLGMIGSIAQQFGGRV
jgi:hypothetical protein